MWATQYTPNNDSVNHPGILSDGRMFTNYIPNSMLNETIKKKNNIQNNEEYRKFLVNNTTKNVLHYDKKRRQKKNSSYGYYYYIDFALVDVTSSLLPPPPLYRAMKETMTYIKGKKRGNRRAIREWSEPSSSSCSWVVTHIKRGPKQVEKPRMQHSRTNNKEQCAVQQRQCAACVSPADGNN